jgi:hypothetical protein
MYGTGKVLLDIFCWKFVLILAFIIDNADSCMLIKMIVRAFAGTIDKKVLFFINKFHNIPAADLIFGCHLDGHGGTGFRAESTEDATGKIDPEPLRIAPAFLPLGWHERNAIHRTGGGAKKTGNAAFLSIRVPCQHDPGTIPWRKRSFLFRILYGHFLFHEMLGGDPQSREQCFNVFYDIHLFKRSNKFPDI